MVRAKLLGGLWESCPRANGSVWADSRSAWRAHYEQVRAISAQFDRMQKKKTARITSINPPLRETLRPAEPELVAPIMGFDVSESDPIGCNDLFNPLQGSGGVRIKKIGSAN
jgi:hypothetical protein